LQVIEQAVRTDQSYNPDTGFSPPAKGASRGYKCLKTATS
jgi:hypothetical protein